MGFLVFSHTRMGSSGFCTNIGGRNQRTGEIVQIRLRVAPNESLRYSQFGERANQFRNKLRPGSSLAIQRFFKVTTPRISHPEDLVIRPEEVFLLEDEDLTVRLHEYAEEMAYEGVHDLFPNMFNGNGKWYRPAQLANAQAVGYVRAKSVDFYTDFDKLRARVTDAKGNDFSTPVVGVDLLESHSAVRQSLVRLSLAGGFTHEKWQGTVHPERCFLMLSHVIT